MSERKIVHRLFFIWDWEAEEIWLNREAQKGWNLVKVGLCRYTFEKGEPGGYQYRLQALNSHASTEESQSYLAFVESTGAEVVDTFLYWVYFRQRTDLGPFEIFSDHTSRIKHMKHVMAVIYTLLPVMILNLVNLVRLLSVYDGTDDLLFVLCMLMCIVLAAFFALGINGLIRMHKKLRKMQEDEALHE